jgi:hypothetical protein
MGDESNATRDNVPRDLVYTAVGLGVLGIQHVQVRRRQFERGMRLLLASVPCDRGHAAEKRAASR